MAPSLPIYINTEVEAHDSAGDCWISIFERVLGISGLLAANPGELTEPLVAAGGQDVSHWFVRGADGLPSLRTYVDPVTNLTTPVCPQGRFLHVPETAPVTTFSQDHLAAGGEWWRDPTLVIGVLSHAPRAVRIVNTLTSTDHTLGIGAECTIGDIRTKYAAQGYNAHSGSYAWKGLVGGRFVELDMGATLTQAGVSEEGAYEEAERMGLDPDAPENLPVLLIYFLDDLTVA